ncbi:S-adenosyl-L-methionine-dependent methyltransferase [Aspergillus indologenus CBS 114.80]|uniref:S-adenosyl-L-methionine-dependent methyltransferase n=1 Tax=Aspergillus indologenus CBS 114.80 TaxID=1450541 RepID=A0A2V5IG46_9EURO|nr:S-adenosyl-L-methionine-dependent methyltransferase [Aspergillus indologenus CBS 114.80]
MAPISLCDGGSSSSSSSSANSTPTPTAPESFLPLLEQIKQAVQQEESPERTAKSHFQLLGLVDQLRLAIESPTETLLRLIYQPPQNAALRTVMDMNLFPLLMEHRPAGLSATALAEKTGAERALIVRLMRVMASLGLCSTPTAEHYAANEKTAALVQPIGRDGVPCIYDLTLPTLSTLPTYFATHAYTTPKEYAHAPMKWAVGASQFEWLAQHKPRQQRFNAYMASRRAGKPEWFDIYPVPRLTDPALPALHDDPEAVLIVDVGGNQGHDLLAFQARFPDLPGRRVLQDLPKVVNWEVGHGVEAMGCSFLEEQVVKAARTYYFRAIFHDWPDATCHRILQNTVAAMDPAHSRVLIVDMVLPDTEVPLLQASLDIQMMSIGAGVERSERQWRELLGAAGLEVTGIWNTNPGMESVIEAVVRQ